jgi:exodeoxyribonuclease-3
VNGRFPVLLRWLEQAHPDIVCLQELKSPQERFPKAALEKAGYGAIWHGQKSWNGVAILARGADPIETRRGLPGDPDDVQSRYIEAVVNGLIVGCLYMPNGNPAPARNSTTSWLGSNACKNMPGRYSSPAIPSSWPATICDAHRPRRV